MRSYKVKVLLKGILLLAILCVICYFIWDYFEKQEKTFEFTIRTRETQSCSTEVKLYHTAKDGKKYYLDCLDYVIVSSKEEDRSLKSILEEEPQFLDKVVKQMRTDGVFWDGGSLLYKTTSKNGFTNHGLAILQCKTISGNRNYYIGPSRMEYETGFCVDPIDSKEDILK